MRRATAESLSDALRDPMKAVLEELREQGLLDEEDLTEAAEALAEAGVTVLNDMGF